MNNKLELPKMRRWYAGALALTLSLVAPGWALAQSTIRAVTGGQQAGGEVVRVELSEALAVAPSGFAIQAPPRVAIDLPGVVNAMGKSSVELNQGNVRSVNVASSGERTRLVLNLKQAASYRTELQGKTLLILLDSAAVAAQPTSQPVHFANSQNVDQLALRDIDFRRGPDGAGRVIIGLASTQIGVDLKQQGQNLVVEFLRSTLPENMRRKLDVSDFGSPVQSISTVQSGDRVRMVIEARGAWEHSAYQTDDQFVLEVRPVRMDPNKVTQGPDTRVRSSP